MYMRIWTSYFANLEKLESANIYCVAICNKVPAFFKGPNIESVAPNNSILWEYKKSAQTDADRERYKQRYVDEVLCAYRFHPEYFTDLLQSFSNSENGKDIALICYERPEDFCHRHILAEWLNERLSSRGIIIEEYPVYAEKKNTSSTTQKKKTTKVESYELF